jgi:amino acid adenylation domain-containing protein
MAQVSNARATIKTDQKTTATNETIYGCFRDRVQDDPQAIAVIDANAQLSRLDLDNRACEVAACLPTTSYRVGVAMHHGAAQIAAILGVLKAGAAYVPVEPDFPIERIRYMMENAQVDCVITDYGIASVEDALAVLDQTCEPRGSKSSKLLEPQSPAPQDPTQQDPAFTQQGSSLAQQDPALATTHDAGLAYILYTSGTTGKPKGVMITNANVCNYIDAFAAEFKPSSTDVMLQYSVCSFDIFVEEVFSALLTGMTLAIPSPRDKADIGTLMEFVERERVSIISGFPYLLQEMNDLDSIPFSLRLLISGGDVLRARYIDRLLGLVDVYNTYGPSETTVCASYFPCNPARKSTTSDKRAQPSATTNVLSDGTYPVGAPVRGVHMYIMNENLEEVPAGEVGEIVITGRGVGLGYVGCPPEQKNYVHLPDGTRAYRSGDMGYVLPDDTIAFMHRKDTQVMIDGRRVEPAEVESVLCTCPEVEVGVVRSEVDAHQMPYLVGYYVPVEQASERDVEQGAKADVEQASEVEAHLRDEMSRYLAPYMLPEYFVKMDHLPLTPNGKVDTRALPHVQRA